MQADRTVPHGTPSVNTDHAASPTPRLIDAAIALLEMCGCPHVEGSRVGRGINGPELIEPRLAPREAAVSAAYLYLARQFNAAGRPVVLPMQAGERAASTEGGAQ